MSIALVVIPAASLFAQLPARDLSRYRQFQLGASMAAVAQQARISPEPRVVHQRPALIEELMWQPQPALASTRRDSVRSALFSFYNGQLFRIVVTYEQERTEGLTTEDMIEAVSATYGLALLPVSAILPSWAVIAHNADWTLANWEDSESSIRLMRSAESTFTLVALSKRLDALARVATAEALRLDAQDAPHRQIERQQMLADETRVKMETARRLNKATFQP
jgi:hypothetical protein